MFLLKMKGDEVKKNQQSCQWNENKRSWSRKSTFPTDRMVNDFQE